MSPSTPAPDDASEKGCGVLAGCGCLGLVILLVLALLGLLFGDDDEGDGGDAAPVPAVSAGPTGDGDPSGTEEAKTASGQSSDPAESAAEPSTSTSASPRSGGARSSATSSASPSGGGKSTASEPASSRTASSTSSPAPTTPTSAPEPSAGPSSTRTATPVPAAPVPAPSRTETAPDAPTSVSDPVTHVVDGDTVDVRLSSGEERIRIIGLDTPEIGECGFEEASAGMADLVGGAVVTLERDPTQDNRDRYGRLVRHVRMSNGDSAAVRMIRRGLSAEYLYGAEYQHRSEHLRAERLARAEGLGVWSGRCPVDPTPTPAPTPTATPEPAPAPVPAPIAPVPAPTGSCLIKGNIASDGEKIFHSPGQQHYEKTKISPEKGERWFCSAAEAIEAGWSAAKR